MPILYVTPTKCSFKNCVNWFYTKAWVKDKPNYKSALITEQAAKILLGVKKLTFKILACVNKEKNIYLDWICTGCTSISCKYRKVRLGEHRYHDCD